MSFVRPEATAALRRWRDALAGAGLSLLGLWGILAGGLLLLVGALLMIPGLALLWVGIQRARFRKTGEGPGVVQVTEGRVAYFGPLSGGVVDMPQLRALWLDPTQEPAHWRLDRPDEPPLFIPLTATGADALFDAFAALPGLDTRRMLRAMEDHPGEPVEIWRRAAPVHTSRRLH